MALKDPDALWLAGITLLVSLVYAYHLYRTARKWFVEEHSTRAFRNFFIAIMLQLGFFRIFIGSMVRAFPGEQWLVAAQGVAAPLLSLMLLSGGFVLYWTWRNEPVTPKKPDTK